MSTRVRATSRYTRLPGQVGTAAVENVGREVLAAERHCVLLSKQEQDTHSAPLVYAQMLIENITIMRTNVMKWSRQTTFSPAQINLFK